MVKKVAIIGAGLSGLACAHELIRHGIIPTVFESKGYLGEVLDLPVLTLKIYNMPISHPLRYFKTNFGLDIKPNFSVKKMIMYSPSKSLSVNAPLGLGFIFKRGKYNDSIESQIMNSINIPINFNSYINLKDMKEGFEHIVVCTGTPDIAFDLNLYKTTFTANIRIATIIGEFKTDTMIGWLNTVFAKSGYAYLIPNSENDARLVLITTNIYPNELDYYWDKFLKVANIDYNIRSIMDLNHVVGHTDSQQYKNVLFCGNAAGFLDDVLGFGSMKAITSGLFAAKAIVENKAYSKLVQKLNEDVKQMSHFRTSLNTFDNNNFDQLFTIMGLPIIKQWVFHNPFMKMTNFTRFAQIYSFFVGR